MFSTATTPQDAKNRGAFAGQTVAALTGRTFTALPDYMAENHGMVHPNYIDRVPVFAGSVKISSRSVTYSLALNPGAATLRQALTVLEVDGQVEISAAETGQVTARNIGEKPATLVVDGGDERVRLRPGAVSALR